MKYSKEEAILALKTFAASLGRTPSYRDYRNHKIKPSTKVIQDLFGSWSKALQEAQLEPIKVIKYSKEDAIKALQEYNKTTGNTPTYNEILKPSSTTIEKLFGSWNEAIKAAGLEANLYRSKYTKDIICDAILRFYSAEKRVPKYDDFTGLVDYPSGHTVCRYFNTWNDAIVASGLEPVTVINSHDKENITKAIQRFVSTNGRIPTYEDFKHTTEYPSPTTVRRYFNTWNMAIEASGFTPNEPTFGVPTTGLDGHLYRSTSEAYFADKFLFEKYDYVIEPKYPSPYKKYYDWYVPSIGLYIELDGEIRPDAIKEKIEINKSLSRNCLILTTKDMYKITNSNFLQEQYSDY